MLSILQLLGLPDLWPRWKSDLVTYACGIIIALAVGAFGLWRRRQAQSWPMVQGTVEWTQVRLAGEGHYETRIPEVCYSYSVNGEYYSGSHAITEANLDKFAKGSRILVHHHPSDPSVSYLDLKDVEAHEEAPESVS